MLSQQASIFKTGKLLQIFAIDPGLIVVVGKLNLLEIISYTGGQERSEFWSM